MALIFCKMFRKVFETAVVNTSRTSSSAYLISSNKVYDSYKFRVTSFQSVGLRTYPSRNKSLDRHGVVTPEQEYVRDISTEDLEKTKDVFSKVNEQIKQNIHGRLFAVVQMCGKQFKVTEEDIIIVEGYWPPTVGNQLKLEKVLLAGGSDFTLIGRPILPRELIKVEATVIEKTLSYIKTHFRKKRRKQYMRINFYRSQYTMLRINTIEFTGLINDTKEDKDWEERIF